MSACCPGVVAEGTGPQGCGFGARLCQAGATVVIGSRGAPFGAEAGAKVRALPSVEADSQALTDSDAATSASTVLLAVLHKLQRQLVTGLTPKLTDRTVVNCVSSLGFDDVGPYRLHPQAASAAGETAGLVPDVAVGSAFHHLAAGLLLDPDVDRSGDDMLVCDDDSQPSRQVIALATAVTDGRGVDAGSLRIARQPEPLTAAPMGIRYKYRTHAGISPTGLPFPTTEESTS